MADCWGAVPSTPADGVAAASSAWTADLRGKTLGKELPQAEERKYASLVTVGQERKLAVWGEFDVVHLVAQARIEGASVNTRWVLTRKVIEGSSSAKACLVVQGFQDPDPQQGLGGMAGRVSFR